MLAETAVVTRDALKSRIERFDLLCRRFPGERPTPLMAAHRLEAHAFARLQWAARLFLSRVLRSPEPILEEEEIVEQFSRRREEIRNVTPTGMILPKNYSILEFNVLMREFYQAMGTLGIDDLIEVWQIPMHIRIKYPEARRENLDRPRHAPEELHCDSWSGYSTHGVTVLIPLLGDIEGNRVAFYRPRGGIDETWLGPAVRKERPDLAPHYQEVPYGARRGEIQLFDAATLHATHRTPGCGIRFSIDNILVPRLRPEGSMEVIEAARRQEQLSHRELLEIGTARIFCFPDRDDQFKDTQEGAVDPTTFSSVRLTDPRRGERETDRERIDSRDRALSSLCRDLPLRQSYPLIKEVEITAPLFRALQRAVTDYLCATLAHSGHHPEPAADDQWVRRYGSTILSLPNVTPNGVIRPKRETFPEFNTIHRRVAAIVRSLGIDRHILKMRMPLSLRIVDGTAPPWIENRPRANNKMHSDFWTGSCCDLAFLLPVLGDIENTTVRFAEPRGMAPTFLTELPSYDEGRALYQDCQPYPMSMRKGFLYFQDIYCLHATSRNGGGPRLSLDWTIQTENYPAIEALHSSKALLTDNHFPMEEWYRLGERYLYVDEESLEECRRRFESGPTPSGLRPGSAVAEQTSSRARIVSLDGAPDALSLARFS
jgi:hypothetical protein